MNTGMEAGMKKGAEYDFSPAELEKLGEQDQESLRKFRGGELSLSELVAGNTERIEYVKKYIALRGFPKIGSSGHQAYEAAVLVALHSGDFSFMEMFLANLQTHLNEVDPKHIAYLTDKICLAKGEKQIYGTQYKISNTAKDNKDNADVSEIFVLPIQDKENVDQRRKELGMETLAGYLQKIKRK